MHLRGAAFGGGRPVERHNLAVDAFGFFRSYFEGEYSAGGFRPGRLDGLPGFKRDGAGELFVIFCNARADFLQHVGFLPGRQLARDLECLVGSLNGAFNKVCPGMVNHSGNGAIVRAANLNRVVGVQPLAIDENAKGTVFGCAAVG